MFDLEVLYADADPQFRQNVDRIKAAVEREGDRPEATTAPDRIEEKLQEEIAARRQAQRRLRILLDRIPNPIFYKERGGEYPGCNEAFEEILQAADAAMYDAKKSGRGTTHERAD